MSEQGNVKTVLDLYAAFGRGDVPAILDLLADDVDWWFFGPKEIPFAGRYRGRGEMMKFFGTVGETVEVEQFGPEEGPIARDDRIIVLGRERVKVKATGRTFETHWVHVFTLRNGKVTRLREYYDTATMAAAFALPSS